MPAMSPATAYATELAPIPACAVIMPSRRLQAMQPSKTQPRLRWLMLASVFQPQLWAATLPCQRKLHGSLRSHAWRYVSLPAGTVLPRPTLLPACQPKLWAAILTCQLHLQPTQPLRRRQPASTGPSQRALAASTAPPSSSAAEQHAAVRALRHLGCRHAAQGAT